MTEPAGSRRDYPLERFYRPPPCTACGRTRDEGITGFVVCHHCGRRLCSASNRSRPCGIRNLADPSFWRYKARTAPVAWHCETCFEDHHRVSWLLTLGPLRRR